MGSVNPSSQVPDWLSQLAPDHAPPPSDGWPPAPGWWLLAVLIIAMGLGLWRWWRHPPRRLRRVALAELRILESASLDDGTLAQQLELLMRRYAVSRYGRAAVAGLSGARWIEFVVSHGGQDWSGAPGSDLLRLAYGGQATAHRDDWFKGARAFVKSRRAHSS